MSWENFFSLPEPANEVTFAEGRLPYRTYISRSFTLKLPASQDHGRSARYITKVFDERDSEDLPATESEIITEECTVATTPAGRKQIKVQVAREAGNVRQLLLQKVPTNPDADKLETLLDLDRAGAQRLIDFVRVVDSVPVEGEKSVRIDDQVLQDFFKDPDAMAAPNGNAHCWRNNLPCVAHACGDTHGLLVTIRDKFRLAEHLCDQDASHIARSETLFWSG